MNVLLFTLTENMECVKCIADNVEALVSVWTSRQKVQINN